MWLELLSKFKKPLAGLVLVSVLCGASYYYGMKSVKPTITERIEVQEKIVEKIVEVEVSKKDEKTKTVTKIIEKPDGSKETVITEETETSEETSKKKDQDLTSDKSSKTDPVAIYPKEKTKYSLGMTAETEISKQLFDGPEIRYGAEAGVRIFGLPAWATMGYQFKTKDVSLGFRYEF